MSFDAPVGTESPPEAAVEPTENTPETTEPADAAPSGPTARPTPPADEVIGVRQGMFGVTGTGDTSGYGRLVQTVAMPGGTPAPYGPVFDEVIAHLRLALAKTFDEAVEKIVVFRGELTLHIRRDHLVLVAKTLRDNEALRFELCLGASGAHYPEDTGRELHALYHLNSITHNRRLRLEVSVPDSDPHLPSLYSVYPTVDWHERETYDFFGILFDGHPSLTRIAMPDDWRGHPQRKDYPLGGIPVEYKGARIPPPDERRTYS